MPEHVSVRFDEKRLERIADLVAHVAERQIQTGHDVALQIVHGVNVDGPERVSHHHEKEDHVHGIEEGHVLPALDEESAVGNAYPRDGLAWVKAKSLLFFVQVRTALVHE